MSSPPGGARAQDTQVQKLGQNDQPTPPSVHRRSRVVRKATIPFLVAHLVPLLAFATGVTGRAVALGIALYTTRLFFITAGYHRYLAHRAFTMGRVAQAVFAFGGATAVQKGPLWWAASHRDHHRFTDTDRDPHSPRRGFWWSHVGWILSDEHFATDPDGIADLLRYPELRWLDEHDWVPPWALGIASYFVAGWSGVVVGFFGSTVLLWHATFAINSVAHLRGFRRYATVDSSRNHPVLALLTFGEGWHNNHHHQPSSARQGLRWWEIDITYRILQVLQHLRIVHDLRQPSARRAASRQLHGGAPDVGLMQYHFARAAGLADRSTVAGEWHGRIAAAEAELVALGRARPLAGPAANAAPPSNGAPSGVIGSSAAEPCDATGVGFAPRDRRCGASVAPDPGFECDRPGQDTEALNDVAATE